MEVGKSVSPNGGCYLTININGRKWSSYFQTPPTALDVKTIELIEASIKEKGQEGIKWQQEECLV